MKGLFILKWSAYFQSPAYLEATRMFAIRPELRSIVLGRCGIGPGMKVLDVGCGTGYLARFLAGGMDIHVTGLDRDALFIEEAARLAKDEGLEDRTAFVAGDALALPFEDDVFDAVVSHTFFTSISDPPAAMEEMRRVCRLDGRISSITSMSYMPQNAHSGHYPPDDMWRSELSVLTEKVWTLYQALDPIASYQAGLNPADLPAFFANTGLCNVEIFPIGKGFSLSDASVSAEQKRRYIEKMQQAWTEKINHFMELPKSRYYLSESEHTRYLSLLERERDELLKNVGENSIWQWDGGASLLVSGCNRAVGRASHAAYDKHKDERPEATLNRIKDILKRLNIETEITWVDSRIAGCYSNRVSIKGTPIGTNGKGTNRIYAETSAYAELMERLQNGLYYFGTYAPGDQLYRGIRQAPDEITISGEEILARGGDYLEYFFSRMGAVGYLEKLQVLKNCNCYDNDQEKAKFIPFTNVGTGTLEYLPVNIIFSLYGSNGMCAGNTMEEALVQGLSEVFERYVTRTIIEDRITPPAVDDSVLQQFGPLWDIIRSIRQNGRYEVVVKDCSLGKNYPVMGTIILDRETGRFGVKFGAHPSMEIALERTLTEAFQGQNLEQFTSHNLIGSDEEVYGRENALNIFKIGAGFYPPEILGDEPSYPFRMFDDVVGRSNRELMGIMINKLLRDGINLYIRDVSSLGFPSYFIVAPGVTELYPVDAMRFRELMSLSRIFASAGNMRGISNPDVERLVRYTWIKQGSLLENNALWILGRPFSQEYPGQIHGGLYLLCLSLYRLGRYNEAAEAAAALLSSGIAGSDSRCMYRLITFRAADMPETRIREVLPKLFQRDIAERVIAQFLDGDVFQNTYPETTCWDCARCPSAHLCSYPEVAALRRKLQDCVIEAAVSQERMRVRMKDMLEEWK